MKTMFLKIIYPILIAISAVWFLNIVLRLFGSDFCLFTLSDFSDLRAVAAASWVEPVIMLGGFECLLLVLAIEIETD